VSWDLEGNALSSAKGIEELLGIRLELVFVIHIYDEFLTVQDIGSAVGLGVIGYKPIYETKADVAGALEEFDDFF